MCAFVTLNKKITYLLISPLDLLAGAGQMINKISIKDPPMAIVHFYTFLSYVCFKITCSRTEQLGNFKELLDILVYLIKMLCT